MPVGKAKAVTPESGGDGFRFVVPSLTQHRRTADP